MRKEIKLWMPVTKNQKGEFVGILSDNSIDRDGEFMTKELLDDWAKNKVLPALANHENKMEKFVGGWKRLRTVRKGSRTALVATPFFFSKEANPLAFQIQKQVEEAVEAGLNPGISIGAIPKDSIEKEIDGELHTGFTKAELLEATWVPIQSNRNASFGHIAKEFDLEKPCSEDKPKPRRKEEDEDEDDDNKGNPKKDDKKKPKKDLEDGKMSDVELEKQSPEEAIAEAEAVEEKEEDSAVEEAEAKVEEAEDKVDEAEAKVEEAEAKVEEADEKLAEAEARAEEAEKKLEEYKAKMPTVEGPNAHEKSVDDEPFSIEKGLKIKYGG